jgi:hypothetical protein
VRNIPSLYVLIEPDACDALPQVGLDPGADVVRKRDDPSAGSFHTLVYLALEEACVALDDRGAYRRSMSDLNRLPAPPWHFRGLSSPPPLLLWVAAGNASRQAPFGGSLQMRGTDFWGLP